MEASSVLAMEANELDKMLPALQSSDRLIIELTADAQYNPFTLSIHGRNIRLPHREGQFHPSCNEFVNNVVCSFLNAHASAVQSLVIDGSHHIPRFLSNVLSCMSGKGITSLTISNYNGDISPSEPWQKELDLLFRPLLELTVYANEVQVDDASHSELGRLISLASSLKSVTLGSLFHLADAGLINLMNGLYSLENVSKIRLHHIQLGRCQKETLERLLYVLKSLPSLMRLKLDHGSTPMGGPVAALFWRQLLQLPNLSLVLINISIPDSAAPLIHNFLADPDCQVKRLELDYWADTVFHDSVTALEAIYSGVALSLSIKSMKTEIFKSCSPAGSRLHLAICNMVAVNTSLTKLRLWDKGCAGVPRDSLRDYSMYFKALLRNHKLAVVSFKVSGKIDNQSVAAMGSYLQSSTVLEEFAVSVMKSKALTQLCEGVRKSKSLRKLSVTKIPPECINFFVDELAHNNNIVAAKFGSFKSDVMDYYLALNRYGRKYLLDPSFPTKLLPFVFARQSENHVASCIYSCLKHSPHFVQAGSNLRMSRKRPREHAVF